VFPPHPRHKEAGWQKTKCGYISDVISSHVLYYRQRKSGNPADKMLANERDQNRAKKSSKTKKMTAGHPIRPEHNVYVPWDIQKRLPLPSNLLPRPALAPLGGSLHGCSKVETIAPSVRSSRCVDRTTNETPDQKGEPQKQTKSWEHSTDPVLKKLVPTEHGRDGQRAVVHTPQNPSGSATNKLAYAPTAPRCRH